MWIPYHFTPIGCCKKIVVANLGYCFRHTGTNKQNHKFCLPVFLSVSSTCSLYINDILRCPFCSDFIFGLPVYQVFWLFPINNRKTIIWTASYRHRVWDFTGLFSQGILDKNNKTLSRHRQGERRSTELFLNAICVEKIRIGNNPGK